MTKPDLLKHIADTAYNVGFGAKKHFATYDITDKVPAVIGFASTAIGIFSLFVDWLATKVFSAAFIVLGVLGISIALYDHKKAEYAEVGQKLTQLFNKLKALYFNVKAAKDADLPELERQLAALEEEYGKTGISDQILFSGWFAHYKFFWEHQIDWINEQKHFKFFRDKLPLSFTLSVGVIVAAVIVLLVICWLRTPVVTP
ncbi:MAG TPA: SLATT domain-containing protein [Verrucomicrobiae bacterium]|nr:SLATT domain-containing protein [Verrucomicrobiae bacterium]